jgi:hypothetical protein
MIERLEHSAQAFSCSTHFVEWLDPVAAAPGSVPLFLIEAFRRNRARLHHLPFTIYY